MRQIGTLAQQVDAVRFADYLVAHGVDARAESDGANWTVWVRDENQVEKARSEFAQYVTAPDDARYADQARAAEEKRRAEQERRNASQRNIVEMRGNWTDPSARRAPLTIALIGLMFAVSMLGGYMSEKSRSTQKLFFLDPSHTLKSNIAPSIWTDISSGQIWRLVTPAFLHGDITHLLFNAWMLYALGTQIEHARGTPRFGLLVLILAVGSNVTQAFLFPLFGGMSGVNYGLLGYVWMRAVYVPGSGMYIPRASVIMALVWFVMGMANVVEHVANGAHGAGLALGLFIGYLPRLKR